MATGEKISALNTTTAQSTDLIPIARDGANYSVTAASIAANVTATAPIVNTSGNLTFDPTAITTSAITPLTGTEIVALSQGGVTKKAVLSSITGPEIVLSASTFSGDCSSVVNSSLASGNVSLRFTRGTYTISSDILISSNTYIVVDEGAVINCTACHWTGYLASNVIFEINGTINALSFSGNATLNVQKGSWPQYPDGTGGQGSYGAQNLRGFIELGGTTSSLSTNLLVTGKGLVNGDWVKDATWPMSANSSMLGSPILWSVLYNKGIAIFNANDVTIDVAEVVGFAGEAVYYDGAGSDIVFSKIYSHDHNFNALNFNVVGATRLEMVECKTNNSLYSVELSEGTVRDCTLLNPYYNNVQTGGGYVGKVKIINNVMFASSAVNVPISAYAYSGNTGAGEVVISNNIITCNNTTQYNDPIQYGYMNLVNISNNTILQSGTTKNRVLGNIGWSINNDDTSVFYGYHGRNALIGVNGATYIYDGVAGASTNIGLAVTQTGVVVKQNNIPLQGVDETGTVRNLAIINNDGTTAFFGYHGRNAILGASGATYIYDGIAGASTNIGLAVTSTGVVVKQNNVPLQGVDETGTTRNLAVINTDGTTIFYGYHGRNAVYGSSGATYIYDGVASASTNIGITVNANWVILARTVTKPQSTPTTITTAGATTLTTANMLTGIIQVTQTAAVGLTLPLGSDMETALNTGVAFAVDQSFEWNIINTGTSLGAITMNGNTGSTYVGNATVAIGTSATFRTRKTATSTYVTYRVN